MRYSIIVPVYNAEQWLRRCLDSVRGQTCGDWECICVDDGSEDDSFSILQEYSGRDARFAMFTQSHQGIGPARNIGMSVAKGDYLVFLDADDTLMLDALEQLQGVDADIISFLPVRSGGIFDSLAGNMIAWNAIYRRDTVAGIRFPCLVNCEDLVFAAEAIAKARTVKIGVPVWYRHNVVKDSAFNSHSWRRVKDSWTSIWLMRDAYRPMLEGFRMRLMLHRKLLMHFVLHVLAEVPKAMYWGFVKHRGCHEILECCLV